MKRRNFMAATAALAVASIPAVTLAQAAEKAELRKIVWVGEQLTQAEIQTMLRAHPEAKGGVIRRTKGRVFLVTQGNVTPEQAKRQGVL